MGIFGNFESCPDADQDTMGANSATKNCHNIENIPELLDRHVAVSESAANTIINAPTTPPISTIPLNDDGINDGDQIPKGRSFQMVHRQHVLSMRQVGMQAGIWLMPAFGNG